MVCASYCATYPKQPYIKHEVSMWCIYYITSLLLEPSTSFSSPVINVVTTLSNVTDVTV